MSHQHKTSQGAAPSRGQPPGLCVRIINECSLPEYQVPISGMRILSGSGQLNNKPRQVAVV